MYLSFVHSRQHGLDFAYLFYEFFQQDYRQVLIISLMNITKDKFTTFRRRF